MKLRPTLNLILHLLGGLAAVALFGFAGCSTHPSATDDLSRALTFHASFDHGVNADFAVGGRGLSNAPSLKLAAEAQPGLPASGEVQRVEAGRFGHALRFVRPKAPLVFFPAAGNLAYRTNNWSGTVSFWLQVDPATELAPGYCDPIQITPRAWNDAAFFVEFEKKTNAIPFRLGVYADLGVWNPLNRKWDDLSPAEKPLLTVDPAPFRGGQWTHVLFTFENFNTGRPDGVARLYLNGEPRGEIFPRLQTFTWDEAASLIMLGVGYVGLWDELAVFNRALSPAEVLTVYGLPRGIAGLHR